MLGTWALAALALPAALQPASGRVQGTLAIRGLGPTGGAAVYLDGPRGQATAPQRELRARMDQRGLDFRPHLLVVVVGTTVEFTNSDSVLHNVFAAGSTGESFDLGTWPRGETRTHRFDRRGVTTLLCKVHPEMEAYIVVVPTELFAVTSAEGTFAIDGVPPGEYVLTAWHERCWPEQRSIRVSEGSTVWVDLVLEPAAFP